MKALVIKRPIIIMGGGPAGVMTACGLVDLGHEVIIITRPRPFPAWEGLSERPLNSLRLFGFLETVGSVGPKVQRMAHWDGMTQAQNQEYILARQSFDQALLRDAQHKGVQIIDGRVDQMEKLPNGWRVTYHTASGTYERESDFLVEARGRESKLGRKAMAGENDYIAGPATSALLKSYEVSSDLEAMTSVASFPKGWAWYLRDGKGKAILQIFVSSEKGKLPPKAGLEDFFSELVQQLPEAKAWLDKAIPHDGSVSVRTAAANKSSSLGGDDYLVVGDGCLALDPLSGNGIFYALGSGLAAAPVINTLLEKPEHKAIALQFFQERRDNAFTGGCMMGREFYALERRWPDEDFWKSRSCWPSGDGSSHPDPLSKPVEICGKPVIKDGLIEWSKVIVTADHPRGVWKIDGVPLVSLLDLVTSSPYDVRQIALELNVEQAQIAVAKKWLTDRNLIPDKLNRS